MHIVATKLFSKLCIVLSFRIIIYVRKNKPQELLLELAVKKFSNTRTCMKLHCKGSKIIIIFMSAGICT